MAEESSASADKISMSTDTQQTSAIQRLYDLRNDDKNHGVSLLLMQFKAMIYKRLLYFKRRWTVFIPQLIVPVLYMALFVWTATTFPAAKEQDPLQIDFKPYASQGKDANLLLISSNWLNNDTMQRLILLILFDKVLKKYNITFILNLSFLVKSAKLLKLGLTT